MDIRLENGDVVEAQYAGWIRERIPEYEELWARVIGHDGKGQPLGVNPGLSLAGFKREAFFQAHYTVLITLLNLDKAARNYDKELPTIKDAEDYLKLHRDITSFMAHVGKIRDMFKIMDGALPQGPSTWKRFDDFYSQRNSVLHGPIPCITLDAGLPCLPQPASRVATNTEWSDKSYWKDLENYRFKAVSEFFPETVRDLLPLVRAALSEYLDYFKSHAGAALPRYQVNSSLVVMDENAVAASGSGYLPLSGTRTHLPASGI
jgi:hypothetical protein